MKKISITISPNGDTQSDVIQGKKCIDSIAFSHGYTDSVVEIFIRTKFDESASIRIDTNDLILVAKLLERSDLP